MKETLKKLVELQKIDSEKLDLKYKRQEVLDGLVADRNEYESLERRVADEKQRQQEIRDEGQRLNREQAVLAYELTLQELQIMAVLDNMTAKNVSYYADSIVTLIRSGKLEGKLKLGEDEYPVNSVGVKVAIWAILYSHKLSNHTQVEDIMVHAADFIALNGQLYRDIYNLMHFTVIPYRREHNLDTTIPTAIENKYLPVLDGVL